MNEHVDPILAGLLDEVIDLKGRYTTLATGLLEVNKLIMDCTELLEITTGKVAALETPISPDNFKLFWIRDNDDVYSVDYQHALAVTEQRSVSDLVLAGYSEVSLAAAKRMGLYC